MDCQWCGWSGRCSCAAKPPEPELRDWHTDAPRVPLSDERMDQIVEEALARQEEAEIQRVLVTRDGSFCSCCGAVMSAILILKDVRECDDCQNI